MVLYVLSCLLFVGGFKKFGAAEIDLASFALRACPSRSQSRAPSPTESELSENGADADDEGEGTPRHVIEDEDEGEACEDGSTYVAELRLPLDAW